MASIKIKLYKGKTYKGGSHPIILQVIHNKIRKYITTGYKATEKQWDDEKDLPNRLHPNSKRLKLRLRNILADAEDIVLKMEDTGKPLTSSQIMDKVSSKTVSVSVYQFVDRFILSLKDQGRHGNAKVYTTLKSVLKDYSTKQDIEFEEVDYSFLKGLEGHLIKKGVKVNTISNYMRTLRALFNHAMKEELVNESLYPFKQYKIKTEKTQKRAISKVEIDKIRDLDLTDLSYLVFARDIFMFSFYNRGMNLADICWLQNKQIKMGRLMYKRKKTGQPFDIKLTDPAKAIIDRHLVSKKPDAFVFPILRRVGMEYQDYLNFKRLVNKHLKEVGKEAKIDTVLTTYVARHSWATAAKHAGITTAIISEGMGHTTEETTQIYLDSFETDILDKANDLITG